MNFRLRSLICLFLSLAALIASFATLLLSETPSSVPVYLFYISSLLFSLMLFWEFRNLVAVFSRSWYWFSLRHLLRVFVIFGIFVALMFITARQKKMFDFTEESFYSLSADSISFWSGFDFKLTVVASQQEHASFYVALQRFSELINSHFPDKKVEWLDPVRTPGRVKELNISEIPCLLLELNGEKMPISSNRLFSSPRAGREAEFHGEAVLTESIARLQNKKEVYLYSPAEGRAPFLNSAPVGFAGVIELLRREGFLPEVIASLPPAESETALLVFLPIEPLPVSEQQKILQRKERQAPTILFFEAQPQNPLPQMAEAWQIDFLGFPVIDLQRHFRNEATFIAALETDHPINAGLGVRQNPPVLPGTTAFIPVSGELNPVLKTSDLSWAKTVFDAQESFPRFDPEHDIKGPLTAAVDAGGRTLLFADTDFLRNQFLVLGGNQNLLLNSVHYVCGNLELMCSRGRLMRNRELNMPTPAKKRMYVVMIFVVPFLLLTLAVILHFAGCRD
jgi:hypothetical protein